MAEIQPTTRLQQLIHRADRVLAVSHAPGAAHARLMEAAGAKGRGLTLPLCRKNSGAHPYGWSTLTSTGQPVTMKPPMNGQL
jgi:hypothetical protein